ncbi:MAG: hypothetical protein KBS83_03325 [Lachnospiraceae bacterium]|nr:hypothetical protein [Candidatus Equihabitans merdae]
MTKKVKNMALVMTLVAAATLSACVAKNIATESTDSTASTPESTVANMENPMKEVSQDQMVQEAGIPLYPPTDAKDVHYYVIDSGEHKIAQMDFTLYGKPYTYRAAYGSFDPTELSGIYLSNPTESYANVSYCEGQILTEGNTSVLFWEDKAPGACYSISCNECEDPSALITAAEETFSPLQDDTSKDNENTDQDIMPSLENNWTDDKCNEVKVTKTGDNSYDVTVNIPRLCELKATASMHGDSLVLKTQDPNGNAMELNFGPDTSTHTCTLRVTQSSWDLLQTGTEFANFVVAAG